MITAREIQIFFFGNMSLDLCYVLNIYSLRNRTEKTNMITVLMVLSQWIYRDLLHGDLKNQGMSKFILFH